MVAAAQVPVYHGPFRRSSTAALACRLRAKPGEAKEVARKGLKRAVEDLLNPPKARLVGRAPTSDGGEPLSPRDERVQVGGEGVVAGRRLLSSVLSRKGGMAPRAPDAVRHFALC